MPRKSTSSAASKGAAASAKAETSEQDTRRRSGRAVTKVETPGGREAGRSRRSSTAAQTKASASDSRSTRSSTGVGSRKASASPSGSTSSKSSKEAGFESPASRSRIRSSRRSTGRINYKESDGEDESRARKKALDVPVGEEEFHESEVEAEEEELPKSPSKRKAAASPAKKSPVKAKAVAEKTVGRRGRKSSSKIADTVEAEEDTEEKTGDDTEKKTDKKAVVEASPPSNSRRSTRPRQSSATKATQGTRRSSRTPSRAKPQQDDEEEEEEDEEEEMVDELETEEPHSEDKPAKGRNSKKRKIEPETEEKVQKKRKVESEDDGKEATTAEEDKEDKKEDKKESETVPEKKSEVEAEKKDDSIDEEKESDEEEEPMEIDEEPVKEASSDLKKPAADDSVDKSATEKTDSLSAVKSKETGESKDGKVENIEESESKDDNSEEMPEKSPQSKDDDVIDIASGSDENEVEPLLDEKEAAQKESKKSSQDPPDTQESHPVHDVEDESNESSGEKVQQTDVKVIDFEPTSSAVSKDVSKDNNPENLSSNSRQSLKSNIECVNIPDDVDEAESSNCLESSNGSKSKEMGNSSLVLEPDSESSLNGMNSNSDDSVKSIEIVVDGVNIPFTKESEAENAVPKANGAHDSIQGDDKDQSVLVSSGRRFVFNASLKEDVRSSLKDKIFEFASYNLGAFVEDGTSQKDELINELNKLKADVICVQEVAKNFFKDVLEPRLDALGYKGIFSVPEENRRGVASFHKSTVFRPTRHTEASLQKLIEKDLEASSLEAGDKAAVHSYLKKLGNVLFTQYSSIKGDLPLTVANVSMPASDVSSHALQMSCLVREVVSVFEGASKPLLLGGTFNMTEGEAPYQLLRDGYLSNDMIEELQRKKDVALPGKENAALVNLLWKAFQHPSSSLCSCYKSVLGKELSAAGGNKTITSPDLLWYSSDCLHTVGVLDVPSSSTDGPKDRHHVALKASVAFSK